MQPFFLHNQKVRWNNKHFSSFLKGYHWSKNDFFGRSEPDFNIIKKENMPEAYWEPRQTYQMKRFAKIVNGLKQNTPS